MKVYELIVFLMGIEAGREVQVEMPVYDKRGNLKSFTCGRLTGDEMSSVGGSELILAVEGVGE